MPHDHRLILSLCWERDLVKQILRGLGIGLTVVEWISTDDFKSLVAAKKYDFIYLGAHADSYGFEEQSGAELTPWEDLAQSIWVTDCLQSGGTLFMGCCRGGMKTVALKIMRQCNKIDQICGPFWKLKGNDITKAFHIFVESLVRGGDDPVTAADRASQASKCKFLCYERLDLAGELLSLDRLDLLEGTLWELKEDQHFLRRDLQNLTTMIETLCLALPKSNQIEPSEAS